MTGGVVRVEERESHFSAGLAIEEVGCFAPKEKQFAGGIELGGQSLGQAGDGILPDFEQAPTVLDASLGGWGSRFDAGDERLVFLEADMQSSGAGVSHIRRFGLGAFLAGGGDFGEVGGHNRQVGNAQQIEHFLNDVAHFLRAFSGTDAGAEIKAGLLPVDPAEICIEMMIVDEGPDGIERLQGQGRWSHGNGGGLFGIRPATGEQEPEKQEKGSDSPGNGRAGLCITRGTVHEQK